MRAVVVMLVLAWAGVAHADRIDMGTWGCNGSKHRTVVVTPGEHDYVWRGSCGGAEGWDVVIKPRKGLVTRMSQGNGELVLHVVNKGAKARKVKMYVFVGFA
jgi:hypothetical protein